MRKRLHLTAICLLCCLFMPVLLVAMLCHAVFGAENRAMSMAIAIDGCGNALFGGKPDDTISARTGRGLVEGARWAKAIAPVIDFIFGKNHCINTAADND